MLKLDIQYGETSLTFNNNNIKALSLLLRAKQYSPHIQQEYNSINHMLLKEGLIKADLVTKLFTLKHQ